MAGSYSIPAGGINYGFIRDPGGNITTFGVPGAIFTSANAINDFGVVAGFYYGSNGVDHGFIRDTLGNIITIDPPGSISTMIRGINNSGQVVGSYSDSAGMTHGFIATPSASAVPEPSTLILLLVGALPLLAAKWRGRCRSMVSIKPPWPRLGA